MEHFLSNGKQQIIAYSNPNQRVERILARTVERIDVQLLYPFETIHLPTLPIEFYNFQIGVSEIVSQESVDFIS